MAKAFHRGVGHRKGENVYCEIFLLIFMIVYVFLYPLLSPGSVGNRNMVTETHLSATVYCVAAALHRLDSH